MKKLKTRAVLSLLAIITGLIGSVFQLTSTPAALADGGDCTDGNKTSIAPSNNVATWTESGQVMTKVCVKSATPHFIYTTNQNDGCYNIEGLGTSTVTVTKVGDGSECQDISHIDVYWEGQSSPTPSPSPSPTPTPTPSPTPSVSPTPSPSVSPTPSPSPSVTPSPSPRPEGRISLNIPGFVCGPNSTTFSGDYEFPFEKRDHYIKFYFDGNDTPVNDNGSNWSTNEFTVFPYWHTVKVELWGVGEEDRLVASQEGTFKIDACPGDGDGGGVGGPGSSEPSTPGQVLGATTMASTGVAEDVIMSLLGLSGSAMTAAGTALYAKGKKN